MLTEGIVACIIPSAHVEEVVTVVYAFHILFDMCKCDIVCVLMGVVYCSC